SDRSRLGLHRDGCRSCRPPGCRNFSGEGVSCPESGFSERVVPAEPVSDGVQQTSAGWQVVLIRGLNLFPPVGGGVGCRKTEHLGQPGPETLASGWWLDQA